MQSFAGDRDGQAAGAGAVRSGTLARAALTLLLCAGAGCAELAALQIPLPTLTVPLDEATVAAGLRQALEVGSGRASQTLARDGGFSENPSLRIPLPGELDDLASTLRSLGFGTQVDRLELQMNRAAEAAVSEAAPVFASAARSMTLSDAFGILQGPPDAATRYFQRQTSAALRSRFQPIVRDGMEEVGLYRAYRDLATQYDRIPFKTTPAPDLEAYITDAALDGLWLELAKEEARIRADPAARSTELLRRVFGG